MRLGRRLVIGSTVAITIALAMPIACSSFGSDVPPQEGTDDFDVATDSGNTNADATDSALPPCPPPARDDGGDAGTIVFDDFESNDHDGRFFFVAGDGGVVQQTVDTSRGCSTGVLLVTTPPGVTDGDWIMHGRFAVGGSVRVLAFDFRYSVAQPFDQEFALGPGLIGVGNKGSVTFMFSKSFHVNRTQWNGDAGTITTTQLNFNVIPDKWFHVEIEYTFDPTQGILKVTIDDVVAISQSGLKTLPTGTSRPTNVDVTFGVRPKMKSPAITAMFDNIELR
jgi:hypothetical protein